MTGELVGVRYSPDKGAGFSGLSTCGSVWVCPVCSSKILARRSIETGVMMLAWENRGGALAMGTLTMRHHLGNSLEEVWGALSRSWNLVTSSRVWRKWLDRVGSPGLVKVVEVNWGSNGWHVHIHFALLLGGGVTDEELEELASWLTPKWRRAVGQNGFDALPVAQDLRRFGGVDAAAQLGEYLAKATAYGEGSARSSAASLEFEPGEALGRELFGAATKKARSVYATVPVWRLLEDIAATGDLELWHRWEEYERVSKGKRQYSVSKGLRELLELGQELTDEEIAAEEAGDRDLVQITRHGWSSILRASWEPVAILELMEQGGPAAVCRFLESMGIEHVQVVND